MKPKTKISPRQMRRYAKPNACWKLERLSPKGSRSSLVRLIAPLAQQKGYDKTMCIAIGSEKRLRDIVSILNSLEVKV